MLYKISCTGMGLACPFMVKGVSLEEVTRLALEHIREAHENDFTALNTPAQIESMKVSLARSARVVPS